MIDADRRVHCDRCGAIVTSAYPHETKWTAGYYHDWRQFMAPHEHDVCDACKWADPYRQVYGVHV